MAQQYSLDLGLDIVPISKDPENMGDMYRLYNAVKLVAGALDLYTGSLGANAEDWSIADTTYVRSQNISRIYRIFDIAVTAGQIVTIKSTGNIGLATTGLAHGWSPIPVAAGQYGEVRLFGLHTSVSGLTPGTWYYSSATAGAITTTVTAQKVGFAVSATALFFNPS